jgi:hypothetical protein
MLEGKAGAEAERQKYLASQTVKLKTARAQSQTRRTARGDPSLLERLSAEEKDMESSSRSPFPFFPVEPSFSTHDLSWFQDASCSPHRTVSFEKPSADRDLQLVSASPSARQQEYGEGCISISFDGFSLLFSDDVGKRSAEFCVFRLSSCSSSLTIFRQLLTLHAFITLDAKFLHHERGAWEPLVEASPLNLIIEKSGLSQHLNLSLPRVRSFHHACLLPHSYSFFLSLFLLPELGFEHESLI